MGDLKSLSEPLLTIGRTAPKKTLRGKGWQFARNEQGEVELVLYFDPQFICVQKDGRIGRVSLREFFALLENLCR